MGFSSFDEWVASSAPYSRSSCYAAMKTLEALKDIPTEKLADIPQKNLHVLKSLSTGVRSTDEALEKAALSHEEFTSWVASVHPDQHLERPVSTARKLTPSLWRLLEEAVSVAMDREGFVRFEDALEAILADYLSAGAAGTQAS